MSFLGYLGAASSAAPSPLVNAPATIAEAKSASLSTHSRGAQQRRGGSKNRNRPVIKTFNVCASQPRTSFALTPATITVNLAYPTTNFVATSSVAPTFGSVAVQLSMFADFATYTSLFDQYRILEVEAWFTPFAAQGATVFGTQTYAVDLDDVNVPVTIASVAEAQSSVISDGGSGTYIRWCPHMAVALFSGAFTSYGNEPAGWIDSASPNVQHFGVKAAYGTTNSSVSYTCHLKARVSFRSAGL